MTTRDPIFTPPSGGTDPDRAEEALSAMYREAGLDEPDFVWVMSPKAGFDRVLAELDERAGGLLEANATRLAAGRGERLCFCTWCRGLSVNWLVHDPSLRDTRWRTPRRRTPNSEIVYEALRRDLPGLSSIEWPTDAGGGELSALSRPFCNPWLTEEVAARQGGPVVGHWWAQLAASAGWWWPYVGFAVVSARPDVARYDDRGRLHGDSGPALAYPDGWSVNAMEGMLLPGYFFKPGELTMIDIAGEQNLELRRLLVDRYGPDRFMKATGGRLLSEDETGQLWQAGDPDPNRHPLGFGHQPMTMVRVVDSTPQADGTHRVYWLHVPPTMRTARQAVAWTFGLTPDQYQPEVQT